MPALISIVKHAAAALVAISVLAGATHAQDHRPSLTVAVQQLPGSLDPAMMSETAAFRTLPSIYDFIIGTNYNEQFAPIPGLATAWRMIDDRTLELDLRGDVVMHDGDAMTAEDVAFSFGPERLSAESSPAYATSRPYLGTLERVDVVDQDTVRFISHEPDPVFVQRLSGWMSQVISKDAFLEADDFAAWQMSPVSTGPYKVASWRPREELVLEAHDQYWGGTPPFSSIRFVEVPEQSARIAGLAAHDYDVITDIDPDQIPLVEQYADLDVVGGDTIMTRSIRFGLHDRWLADPRIRLALSLAIDREAIVQGLWSGRVAVAPGFQFPFYNELFISEHQAPGYDPARARELMEEAGYDGTPIRYYVLEHWYPVELPTSEVIAAMWEAVGFNIDMQVQANWDTILVDNPDFIHNGATLMNIADPLGGVWRIYGKGSSVDRRNQWRNEEFNSLGLILQTSMDEAARRDAFERMLEIVDWEDIPGTELHMSGAFFGIRSSLSWTPSPAPYLDFGPTGMASQ
ncbi:ABC transporter substrate-binding protein [Pelagibacterium sp. H642]|uniref:ABC transporter substrate-binding protein n=1 Tax=Pelagibacterium sp. H642 TaxID=1881069 RepID=UPI002814C4DD|nr:ABC transporter substrate-binding protein [Pelagibacterium sp. H642]WMT92550.1 ABC transporter substrate-binding protein [Pelagibacterium sp. H642]